MFLFFVVVVDNIQGCDEMVKTAFPSSRGRLVCMHVHATLLVFSGKVSTNIETLIS